MNIRPAYRGLNALLFRLSFYGKIAFSQNALIFPLSRNVQYTDGIFAVEYGILSFLQGLHRRNRDANL